MNYDQREEIEKIRKMNPGREMDMLVAEKVFGVKRFYYDEWDEDKVNPMYIASGEPWKTHKIDAKLLPGYSTGMDAALQIVDKFFHCKMEMQPGLKRNICLLCEKEFSGSTLGEGKTPALAICRAALIRRISSGESKIR